ncbi:hypothetical protein [Victivallis vadensis]|uniref:hypothetical protein n=1 Tax=Victivallis vadensis TaxID=172901 RepID=UPI002671B2D8|nr:hypothetical protein [Victivallis vadensis]
MTAIDEVVDVAERHIVDITGIPRIPGVTGVAALTFGGRVISIGRLPIRIGSGSIHIRSVSWSIGLFRRLTGNDFTFHDLIRGGVQIRRLSRIGVILLRLRIRRRIRRILRRRVLQRLFGILSLLLSRRGFRARRLIGRVNRIRHTGGIEQHPVFQFEYINFFHLKPPFDPVFSAFRSASNSLFPEWHHRLQ